MTSFEALIYQAAFNLAPHTVIGAGNSEEILAGAWRGVAEGCRTGGELIKLRGAKTKTEPASKPVRRSNS